VPGSLLKGAPQPRGKATSENGLADNVCPDQGIGKRCLAVWPVSARALLAAFPNQVGIGRQRPALYSLGVLRARGEPSFSLRGTSYAVVPAVCGNRAGQAGDGL
jgi:hypothetical protein